MEELFGVGPKNLQTNFRIEELFSAQNVSRYFPVSKKSVYVNTKTSKFCAVILNISWWTCMTQMVFVCARNSNEYFTKFIPHKFLNFSHVSFFIVPC